MSDPTVCPSHSHSHSVISNQTVTLTHSLTHSLTQSQSFTHSLSLSSTATSLHFTLSQLTTLPATAATATLRLYFVCILHFAFCSALIHNENFQFSTFFVFPMFRSLSLCTLSLSHSPNSRCFTYFESHSFPMIMFRFSDFRHFSHFFTDVRSLQSFCRRRRRCGFIVVSVVLSTIIISFLKLHFCQL